MFQEVIKKDVFELLLKENLAVLAYFSTNDCSVCKALMPKVEELIVGNFPQIRGVHISLNSAPELAAQYAVFTAPTIVMYLENRELFRKNGSFGIHELEMSIARPYHLLFS